MRTEIMSTVCCILYKAAEWSGLATQAAQPPELHTLLSSECMPKNFFLAAAAARPRGWLAYLLLDPAPFCGN